MRCAKNAIAACIAFAACPAAAEAPPSAAAGLPDLLANARVSLSQARPLDALRIWLLQNALSAHAADADGATATALRADLLSSAWAALGETGLCIEGIDADANGAGLWPIAAHHHLIRNFSASSARERLPANPFLAFQAGKQRRGVDARSVLSSPELKNLDFQRGDCGAVESALRRAQAGAEASAAGDARDKRLRNARALRALLALSRDTLDRKRIASMAPIEARIFRLDLFLAHASAGSGQAGSVERALLERAARWTAEDWMALDPESRLLLFPQALALLPAESERKALTFAVLDKLSAARKGSEAEIWIALLDAAAAPETRKLVWAGARGAGLLDLDPSVGFRERSGIALQRGIHLAEGGDVPEAFRAIATALAWADESREAETTRLLARRWVAYLSGHFRVEATLLSSLRQVLPREDFHFVLQDLLWRAALRADAVSFAALNSLNTGRSAAAGRLARLAPLARGKLGEFTAALRRDLETEPFATRKFTQDLVEQLEREESRVRRRLLPVLTGLQGALAKLMDGGGGGNAALFAGELLPRCDALIRGLQVQADGASTIRALGPDASVFAGNVRIAPTDAVPWPFVVPTGQTPSIFTPLKLSPWDKPLAGGGLLAAWTVGEP